MEEEKPPNNQLTARMKFALSVIVLCISLGVTGGTIIQNIKLINCRTQENKAKNDEQDKEIKANRENQHRLELGQREQLVLMTGVRNDTAEIRNMIKDMNKETQRVKEMLMQWEYDYGQESKKKN